MLEVHLAGGGQRESKQHGHLQVPPHDGADADIDINADAVAYADIDVKKSPAHTYFLFQ